MMKSLYIFTTLLLFLFQVAYSHESSSQLKRIDNFGDNPGQLEMYIYKSSKALEKKRPTVVLLHGCTQNAHDYAYGSGWLNIAQKHQFNLIIAQQKRSNNNSLCFNWFSEAHSVKGHGEAKSIAQMITYSQTDLNFSKQKNYITGLSAGAAMSLVMIAAYPDFFESAASNSGVAYHCAKNASQSFMCMSALRRFGPLRLSQNVYDQSGRERNYPTVFTWQGLQDFVVRPSNTEQIYNQWFSIHQNDQIYEQAQQTEKYKTKTLKDSQGAPLVKSFEIPGMRHGQAIDPRNGCGDSNIEYMLDHGVCAAKVMAKEWNLID